ncbi:MAG: hypothetical protein PVJ39_18275 [Gammaproteobacteria bacterium]|jgi:hypothetical protein
MEWAKWISAGILLMMLIFLFPRAKYMLQNSPKGSSSEWMNFMFLIGAVTLFIVLLVMMVR